MELTTAEKLNRIKESLTYDRREMVFSFFDNIQNRAYRAGMKAGLTEFAWWKDGTQYVGTCGTMLADAVATIRDSNHYEPERVDWTTDPEPI